MMRASQPRPYRSPLSLLVTALAFVAPPCALAARQTAPAAPTGAVSLHRETMRQLSRVGLTPESLTAAGATAGDASLVVARFRAACDSLPTSLGAAESARRAAERAHAMLVARSLRTPWNTMLQDITAAKEAVASSRLAEEALQTAAFETSIATLPGAVRTRLATHRTNLAERLPLELSMTPRSNEALKLLCAALVAESNTGQSSLSPEHQAALASARSHLDAVEIVARLAQQLTAVSNAFAEAVSASTP